MPSWKPKTTRWRCGVPKRHWRADLFHPPGWRGLSDNELSRRSDVVGIFPNDAAVVRPIGVVLLEQHDESRLPTRGRFPTDDAFAALASAAPSTRRCGKLRSVTLRCAQNKLRDGLSTHR